jgi:hypothetical protein
MKFKFGKAKTNHQRKPADWQKHPVWVNDFDEDSGDEEHEKPVVGVTNVNREVLNAGLVTIALRMTGSDAPACGYLDYPDGDALAAVWVWHKGQWLEPRDILGLRYPLHFESVPKIKNKPAGFVMKKKGDSNAKATTAAGPARAPGKPKKK